MTVKARKIDVMYRAINFYKVSGQGKGMTLRDCVTHVLEEYDIGYNLTAIQLEQLMVDTETAYDEFIS